MYYLQLALYLNSALLVLGADTDPFMFQVHHPNLTVQILKQLQYGQQSEEWQDQVYSKLGDWEQKLMSDPLFFEHPVPNFLLLKMLREDIEEWMIPRFLRYKFKRIVKVPTSAELRKSAVMIEDMISMHGVQINKGIVIIRLFCKTVLTAYFRNQHFLYSLAARL